MAKNRKQQNAQREALKEAQRLRKQEAIDKRDAKGKRTLNIGMGAIAALIGLVLIAALITEFFVRPNQAAAIVNGEEISIGEWQENVKVTRAQVALGIEDMKELVDDNIAQLQQFAGQQLVLLQDGGEEQLGDLVLDQMVNDKLMEQEAAKRGIVVTEADIDAAIGESFSYFDGALPTAVPDAEPTMMPTPTITPIPAAGTTAESPAPTSEPFPTPEPQPTATAVSEESFNEQFTEELDGYIALGITEAQYRQTVRNQIIRERLTDEFVAELDVNVPHASALIIRVQDEAEATALAAQVAANDDFLNVWNIIRSATPDPDDENPPTAFAYEILWRTKDAYETNVSQAIADELFGMSEGDVSGMLEVEPATEGQPTSFFFVQLTGLEDRDLDENTVQGQASSDLQGFLEGLASGDGIDTFENRLEGRAPGSPDVDQAYYEQQPAPTPFPTIPVTVGAPDPEAETEGE